MPGQGRNARRRFASFWPLWPLSPLVDEVHHVVFVDGIYLSHKLVVLIACTKTHVVGWYVARGENSASWAALFSRIAPPDVVVCDGGSGIASAVAKTWPTYHADPTLHLPRLQHHQTRDHHPATHECGRRTLRLGPGPPDHSDAGGVGGVAG